MPLFRSVLLLLLVPSLCQAQKLPRWRVEASAGIFAPQVLGGSIVLPPYLVNGGYMVPHSNNMIWTDVFVLKPIGGIRIMRQDSNFEYGVGVQALTIKFNGPESIDTNVYTNEPYVAVEQHTYIARPAIPITAFFNFGDHWRKLYALVGLNAGIVLARGKDMQDANTLTDYHNFDIYFHDCLGYQIGGQIGFRRSYGKTDIGLELAANWAHLPLTQGTSNYRYNCNVLYFPVKGYLGYTF
jgi:hypothetical protein